LQGLAKKMEGFNDKTILSEIFLQNAANLKLYTDYVNNFNISMATIKKYVILPSVEGEDSISLADARQTPISRTSCRLFQCRIAKMACNSH
jgi:hypothetical protein